jgi:hypothetical protein
VIVAVIRLEQTLTKFTTRYLFAVTALLAVCLSLYMLPSNLDEYGFWRLPSFIIGISTVTHVLATILSFQSWKKWLFAAIVPTIGVIAWYIYGVRFGRQHPGSIGVYGFLTGGLFWFPIGFALVDFLMLGVVSIGTPKRRG